MILAAGFGTRLLPYTERRPKPLFPLLNEPLLLLTVRHLKAAGFDHIIVNCHYLKEQIIEALDGISGVTVQQEDTVLGTGGGLRLALDQLRDEPLFVSNGDIYHSVDTAGLYRVHCANHSAVTMAMHDCPRFNKLVVTDGHVTGFGAEEGASGTMAFTGLHVLDPEVLEKIPPGRKYSIIDRYRDLIESDPAAIAAQSVDGCSWTDMGTVQDYLDLHGRLLKKEIPLWPEFATVPNGPFVCNSPVPEGSVDFYDWCCVGDVQIPGQLSLKRCVVWDGAQMESGGDYADSLLV